MKIGEVIDYLDSQFVPALQESYDNSGFLVGDLENEITGVLVALDVTPEVIEEAIEKGLNLIVSHHPLIFSGLKRITCGDSTGRMVTRLLQKGIAVYAAHTNLDNLPWGVNGILAQKLGMRDCRVLRPTTGMPHETCGATMAGAGMIGSLPQPMPIMEFLEMVKMRLGLPYLRVSGNVTHDRTKCPRDVGGPGKAVGSLQHLAICGGAGSFLIEDAKAAGADIYLTGDLKYHDFQKADGNMILADIGHYESEQFAKELICRVISEKFSNFACQISEKNKSYIQFI